MLDLQARAVDRLACQTLGGEDLVGTIAATGDIISTDDASRHPAFVYRPETAEESYRGFLGVPIARGGAVVGVLVVQNTAAKPYDEDEIEALQVIASVLAEMFSSGGIVDRARFTDVDSLGQEPRRVGGLRLVEGLGIGKAWLHAPKIEVANLLSDDPALEISRLELAVTGMRDALDRMMDRSDLAAGDQREVLEAYRMFAHDSGWFRRIREAIGTGLSAEAAVRRVQEMTELRLGHASDPYLRERLLDLDDLADRLLMHLAGRDRAREAHALPPNSIIVARNLSAADLIEYDRTRIRGIVLEEGSSTAHLTVVARAFDVPVLGRVERALRLIHNGDLVALDGETGQAFLRPTEDVVEAFRQSIAVRAASRRMFEAHKNEPSVTADGLHVALELNAAFVLDLAELDRVAAEGVGLYRTELA